MDSSAGGRGWADTSASDSAIEELGAIRPSDDVRNEIVRFLEHDNSRVGQVYRLLEKGLSSQKIAEELDVASSGFVWGAARQVRALLEGDLPTAPTVARRGARKFRSVQRSGDWSPEAIYYLEHQTRELERRINDDSAREAEVKRAKSETEKAEARNEAGVYVYSLPHYLLHPYEPESGRTLMKVGRSDSDVIQRFRNQTRITALPEEPVLLRIYRVSNGETAEAEKTFHRLLEAADHYRSVARTAGREWFVTSTRFLDELARALRFDTVVVNEVDDTDDD
ncbi:GIY-YIG nuclease family protein [Dietzia sp. SLG510A3-3B2-2]|nr:GIY-YIG nuclease family protein [Dietzia sp. SLG510A3-40A3]MBB1008121.1 GIY-YIG nuclease family protein [Dietzia sp. SLG510A3-3B2-2]